MAMRGLVGILVVVWMLLGAFASIAAAKDITTNAAAAVTSPEELVRLGLKLAEEQDYASALVHFKNAAEQGSPEGAFQAGLLLLSGQSTGATNPPSVGEDLAGAIRFLNDAAAVGHPAAMRVLGACFAKGRGVPADKVEACKWWRLAANRADESSKLYLDHMLSDLGLKDQEEVQRRVVRFVQQPRRLSGKQPEPDSPALKLTGISGPESRRIALINNQPFFAGEQKLLPVSGTNLLIRCIEITASTVRVQTNGSQDLLTLGFVSR